MGNLIPSNSNNDNPSFNPTQLPGCKIWLDATDQSTLYTTDYAGSVSVSDNFKPTDINGCASWYDSSDTYTLYNTSAGPVSPVSSPLDISGCSLWLDAADTNTTYTTSSGPPSNITSPTQIAGCSIWYDANDAASITLDSNNLVSEWKNKVSTQFYASQSSSSNRPSIIPYNGKNVIRFNGYNTQYLTTNITGALNTDTQDFTLFIVFQKYSFINTALFRDILIGQGSAGCYNTAIFINNTNAYFYATGPQAALGPVSNNSTCVLSFTQTSGLLFNGYNNGIQQTQNSSATGRISYLLSNIGSSCNGSQAFDGHIAEIIVYNSVLSNADRAGVENYLSEKWGSPKPHQQASTSQPIGYWGDKSGNGYHALQYAANNRASISPFPSSNKSGILFNKSQSTYFNINNYPYSITNNFTLFVVLKANALASPDVIMGKNNTGCYGTSLWYSSIMTLRANNGGQYYLYNDQVLNETILTVSRSSSTAHTVFKNGDYITDFTTLDNTTSVADLVSSIGSSCGGVYPYDGYIAEIIAFNRNLSMSEQAGIEKYLSQKWNCIDSHVLSTIGGQIGYWADKSGYARHATQPIASYRPKMLGSINNLQAITFDGTDDYFLIGDLSAAFPNFGEVFIVFEPNNVRSYNLYQTSANYLIYRYAGGDTSQFGVFTSNRSTSTAVGLPTTGVHLTSMRANATSMSVRFDGNKLYSQNDLGYNGGNSHAIGYCYQGGGGVAGIVMNGKIVEIITYNTDIGSENRAKVEEYLAKKWGIDSNLHDTSTRIDQKIGYWKSKGSIDLAVVQHNITKRPNIGYLNGKKAVVFDNVNLGYLIDNTSNVIGLDLGNEVSFFWVCNITLPGSPGSQTVFRYGAYSGYALICKFDNHIEFGGNNGINLSSPLQAKNVPIIEGVIKSIGTVQTSTNAYRNGVLLSKSNLGTDANIAQSNYNRLLICGYNDGSFAGTGGMVIGEFIGYNRALPSYERKLVENYLKDKWNIGSLNRSINNPTDISGCSLWLDASDPKTLFQDAKTTLPVTSDGQSVAYWADKAGGQDVIQTGATSSCPTYKVNIQSGKPMLYFDGGDDLISQASKTTTGPTTVFVVCRVDAYGSDLGGVISFGDSTGGNGGPGILYSSSYTFFLDGNGASGSANSTASSQSLRGIPAVVAAVYNQNSTSNSFMYVNGIYQNNYTGIGVGLTSSNRVQIGARTGGGYPSRRMTGYIAECVVYNRALGDDERSLVENYLSKKWGIGSYSTPVNIGSAIKKHDIKVSNKDAQNWVDRVFDNGGTVSQRTADLVNTFCKQIETAGLRGKFYRLNLFCGNDLNACLTPLYLGPDSNTFYGSAIENNNGFVGSNYTERNGLTSSGASYLLTGISPESIGRSYNGHYSIYQTGFSFYNPAPNSALIGTGYTTTNRHYLEFSNSNINSVWGWVDGPTNSYAGGLYVGSRDSLFSINSYERGAQIGSTSSDSYGANLRLPQYGNIAVFGATSTGNTVPFTYGGTLKSYSIGKAMSAQDVSSFNTIMESFQSSLSRGLTARSSDSFVQVTNEDAKRWIDQVYYNGGTVSPSTALAVNNFCNSIDSAGLRNKFYRLNLFAGSNINSCMAPLYRAPQKNGPLYGNTNDININFISADYTEIGPSGGLKGNASTKYLRTGFTGNLFPSLTNRHLSVYERVRTSTAYLSSIGAGDITTGSCMILRPVTSTNYTMDFNGNAYFNSQNYSGGAFWIGVNDGLRTGALYKNGVVASTGPLLDYDVVAFSREIQVFAIQYNGSDGTTPTDATLASYSIGAAMTASQASDFNSAMQIFQTALSRNI